MKKLVGTKWRCRGHDYAGLVFVVWMVAGGFVYLSDTSGRGTWVSTPLDRFEGRYIQEET